MAGVPQTKKGLLEALARMRANSIVEALELAARGSGIAKINKREACEAMSQEFMGRALDLGNTTEERDARDRQDNLRRSDLYEAISNYFGELAEKG